MTWSTHALFGISSLWLLNIATPMDGGTLAMLSIIAVGGALLPDLDAAESKLKHISVAGIKPLVIPSGMLHETFGHRGALHSLAGLVALTGLGVPLVFVSDWRRWIALVLGYASHLLADSCTRSGIPLLYPQRQRHHVLPRAWRFVTGSLAEEMLLPFLATAVLSLLLSHLPSS